MLEKFSVDESTGTFVEGAVDSDDIALRDELLEVNDAASVDGLGGSWCKENRMRGIRMVMVRVRSPSGRGA